jgi:GT2 family glycosyltransferase
LNRRDVLLNCVRLAVEQTRAPAEIAICDASEDWETSRDMVADLIPTGMNLHYLPAARRSSAVQRNQTIAAVSSDVVFLLDDDSLMYPDCAERIMRVYEADAEGRVAGVSAVGHPHPPGRDRSALTASDRRERAGFVESGLKKLQSNEFLWWLQDQIFLGSGEWAFLAYDDGHQRAADDQRIAPGLPRRELIAGFLLTARRPVAAEFGFDPNLLAYCPVEDADATYRFRRRGLLIAEPEAFLHHFDAAGGRLKRRRVAELQVTNMAFFIRKHSVSPWRDVPRFFLRTLRRLVGAGLRDTVTRSLSFPRSRGVASGLARSVSIFTHDRATLGPWYEDVQRRILE